MALKMAISNKVKEGRFKIFSDFKINKSKTSLLISKLQKLNIDSALFIDGDTLEKSFLNAVRKCPEDGTFCLQPVLTFMI